MVDLLDGHIDIDSVPGKGTTLTITLPNPKENTSLHGIQNRNQQRISLTQALPHKKVKQNSSPPTIPPKQQK
jgi:chemotaxis protein histidine kinase CheA